MKLFIISFGTNSRIVAKFQTDRLWTFRENREEEKNKEIKKPTRCKTYTLAAATLRYADAAGSKIWQSWEYFMFVLLCTVYEYVCTIFLS